MAETTWTNYCSNCIHYQVCKLTNLIQANDNENRKFNTINGDKNRIRVISVSYDCRFKRTSLALSPTGRMLEKEFKEVNDSL